MSNRIEIGNGLALQFTTKDGQGVPSDVWIQMQGEGGKSASFSAAALAERSSGIIGAAVRSWASDRINEYMATKIAEEDAARNRSDNSQFGVGA